MLYTIVSAERADEPDVLALHEFLVRRDAAIRTIDGSAIERAAKNLIRSIKGVRRPQVIVNATAISKLSYFPAETPAFAGVDQPFVTHCATKGGREISQRYCAQDSGIALRL